jgi:putative transposase
MATLLIKMLLALQKPPMPIAALHRQLCRIAVERGQPAPNYKAVYRVVRHLPADLVMLAHEGSKAYRDAFELVHRREADHPALEVPVHSTRIRSIPL